MDIDKNNLEKILNDFETRMKELEQSNEVLLSQIKYLVEENKARNETIINLKENIRERNEEAKAKQEIINNLKDPGNPQTKSHCRNFPYIVLQYTFPILILRDPEKQ
ncbi:13833_t:CDS:2 [Funneliformis geosporum]|uniref:13833_t:CDS:1 n=1 Tax=Funneliformis geosporum TaxID=1117311 RepID=A0A9W4SNI4_9GLOM|nr:13833_t:CDS:2 [Funneliformis geosporum]